jgi:hypothetical protein
MDTTKLAELYIGTWNETDPSRRRAGIAQVWTDDGAYRDPVQAADGRDGIDAMIAGFQEQFPGSTFILTGAVEHYHDRVRFTWDLVDVDGGTPFAGTDVAIVAGDGRLRDIAGFFDKTPATAVEGATT